MLKAAWQNPSSWLGGKEDALVGEGEAAGSKLLLKRLHLLEQGSGGCFLRLPSRLHVPTRVLPAFRLRVGASLARLPLPPQLVYLLQQSHILLFHTS